MVAKKIPKPKQKTKKDSTEKTVKDLCGFSELNCRCCGKGNDEIGGFLLQCATCKKAHYCSKDCFNKDLPKHMEFCQTNEPLHRAPQHREDEAVKLSSKNSSSDNDTFSNDSKMTHCSPSKSTARGSEKVLLQEPSTRRIKKKANPIGCPLSPRHSNDEVGEAPEKQIAFSNSTDSDFRDTDSMVENTSCETKKVSSFTKGNGRKQKKGKATRKPEKDLYKAGIIAKVPSAALENCDTADVSGGNSGKVLCGSSDACTSDRGFRKPKRSTSLSRDEGMSDMSDSDGSYCGSLSDSSSNMSDMTESDGENERNRRKAARKTLRRELESSSNDFAASKPKRFDSSSTLEGASGSINQPVDKICTIVRNRSDSERGEGFETCLNADEGSDCFANNTEIASSDSLSDWSINSGTEIPYQLRRKNGFIVRRLNGDLNNAFSDDDYSAQRDGVIKEICREEIRMKKRLNNLWSLPEATVVEKTTEKRGKLQLSRSMRREKGRMHRCLENLWKLSAASRAGKANSEFAFEDWTDLEDSDSEEFRKRRGGGALDGTDSLNPSSPNIVTETVTLKHLEASEPKHIGWERPEWTEYQLRSTAEGKLIKNAGNFAAFKSRENGKPEWACHSPLRKVSIASKLRSERSLTNRSCTNQPIETHSNESVESFGKLKATERGTMLKRVGSIRLSNRKNPSCEFSIKRTPSTLSRSSSGSISLAARRTKMKDRVVEFDEKLREDETTLSIERRTHDPIMESDVSKKVFDRARILRTTSRGVKLLRGESLRRNFDMQV